MPRRIQRRYTVTLWAGAAGRAPKIRSVAADIVIWAGPSIFCSGGFQLALDQWQSTAADRDVSRLWLASPSGAVARVPSPGSGSLRLCIPEPGFEPSQPACGCPSPSLEL